MRCTYCGMEVAQGTPRCHNCGASQPVINHDAGEAERAPRGTRVIARWRNGLWYEGAVGEAQGPRRFVLFDDGDKDWVQVDHLTIEADPEESKRGALKIGLKVTGQWGDGKWYPGVITGRWGRVWHVTFDDGDKGWLDTTRVQQKARDPGWNFLMALLGVASAVGTIGYLVAGDWGEPATTELVGSGSQLATPLTPLPGPPHPGQRVLAHWQNGLYFAGTVSTLNPDGTVGVSFLDGDQRNVPASMLRRDDIGPGTVAAIRSPDGNEWRSARVQQRQQDRLLVRSSEGNDEWVHLAQIRVRAQDHP